MTKSMTAFASQQRQDESGNFSWEIKSVNHRYLDMSFRLPDVFRELEPKLREKAGEYLKRGKVDCNLRYKSVATTADEIAINQALVKQLHIANEQVKTIFGKKVMVNSADILRWPGVVQTVEKDKTVIKEQALLLFEKALMDLDAARQREGEKLKALLEQRLINIENEVKKVRAVLPDILKEQRERLLERLNEAKVELEANRLEQEMVLAAQRLDVSEELDRLEAHVEEVRRVLNTEEACGRRLDFLMQELNREANTLGSKSSSDVTTKVSVELKVLIEQMREQVQNIE